MLTARLLLTRFPLFLFFVLLCILSFLCFFNILIKGSFITAIYCLYIVVQLDCTSNQVASELPAGFPKFLHFARRTPCFSVPPPQLASLHPAASCNAPIRCALHFAHRTPCFRSFSRRYFTAICTSACFTSLAAKLLSTSGTLLGLQACGHCDYYIRGRTLPLCIPPGLTSLYLQ